MQCVATFYSHIGAVRFSKQLREKQTESILKPVPRSVSSSCGTCCQFESNTPCDLITPDVDGLYAYDKGGYISLWQREE